MRRSQHEVALGHGHVEGHGHVPDRTMTMISYGHYGRPVLVFPSEAGRAWDFENHGMVAAVEDLIDAGRVKLYCVDSLDDWTRSDHNVPTEERAAGTGCTCVGR
jgi:esterase/lipase superfamily enzyme